MVVSFSISRLQGAAVFILALCLAAVSFGFAAEADAKPIRLGIIGLDTSHVVAFTEYLNNPANKTGCKVVAAYPGGSPDIPLSANRLAGFTKQLRDQFGVEIVDGIETLCQKVDGVLLESVDGRVHLSQIKPVLAAKKPVFIDKPVANGLADAMEIYRLAKAAGVPCWSASDWRFGAGVREVQAGKVGSVLGCMTYGSCAILPPYPDLYWYGIHTAEASFALMGPGCESVTRTSTDQTDVVVGRWKDGRVGIFRGGRDANPGDGFVAFGAKGVAQGRLEAGYADLLKEIAAFFKTGKTPVSPQQTLEVLAFMTAADVSKAKGGCPVRLEDIVRQAEAVNQARQAASGPQKPTKKLRIVFLGAHCDDNEVCAGGLMRMLADQGHEVISAYGTTFRRGRMFDGKPEDEVRRAESIAACKLLGAKPHFFPFAHEDLENPLADAKTLAQMAAWLNEMKPDIVVTQWPIDTHPNHRSAAEAALAAYRHSTHVWGKEPAVAGKQEPSWNLYFYEVSPFMKWDDIETMNFRPDVYLDIGKVYDLKKQVVETFKSQASYNLWGEQEKLHRYRGKECGVEYAEAYFLVEPKPGCPLLPVPLLPARP